MNLSKTMTVFINGKPYMDLFNTDDSISVHYLTGNEESFEINPYSFNETFEELIIECITKGITTIKCFDSNIIYILDDFYQEDNKEYFEYWYGIEIYKAYHKVLSNGLATFIESNPEKIEEVIENAY